MVRISVALFVLILVSFSISGTIKFNGFEGIFTSNLGGYIYLCQDGQKVEGTFSEAALLKGGINQIGDLQGEFYMAGAGSCFRGTFQLELTSYGVTGFYICNSRPGVNVLEGVRVNQFRPTDAQCARSYDYSNRILTLEGHWGTTTYPLDLCFRKKNFTTIQLMMTTKLYKVQWKFKTSRVV